jgi:hypothetical protein
MDFALWQDGPSEDVPNMVDRVRAGEILSDCVKALIESPDAGLGAAERLNILEAISEGRKGIAAAAGALSLKFASSPSALDQAVALDASLFIERIKSRIGPENAECTVNPIRHVRSARRSAAMKASWARRRAGSAGRIP